jgi:hypothetical protein
MTRVHERQISAARAVLPNFEVIAMNARNRFHDFLFASITTVMFLGLQSAALAAGPPKADQQQAQEQAKAQERAKTRDRDSGQCKKYVREHHGHPAKGVEIVKVVYVPCPQKGL